MIAFALLALVIMTLGGIAAGLYNKQGTMISCLITAVFAAVGVGIYHFTRPVQNPNQLPGLVVVAFFLHVLGRAAARRFIGFCSGVRAAKS
jgi:hypothetical protein